MARPCKICQDERRQEIEAALVAGESLRTIAADFAISQSSLFRHSRTHLNSPDAPRPGPAVTLLPDVESAASLELTPPFRLLRIIPLAPVPSTAAAEGAPAGQCPVCGGRRWRQRPDGSAICDQCRPLPSH